MLLTALVVTIGSIGPFSFRAAYGHFLSRHIRIYGMWFFTPHALLHVVSFGLLGFLASLISERWPVRTCAIASVVVLGFAIEWVQFQSHQGNPFETWDLPNDARGLPGGAPRLCLVREAPPV